MSWSHKTEGFLRPPVLSIERRTYGEGRWLIARSQRLEFSTFSTQEDSERLTIPNSKGISMAKIATARLRIGKDRLQYTRRQGNLSITCTRAIFVYERSRKQVVHQGLPLQWVRNEAQSYQAKGYTTMRSVRSIDAFETISQGLRRSTRISARRNPARVTLTPQKSLEWPWSSHVRPTEPSRPQPL